MYVFLSMAESAVVADNHTKKFSGENIQEEDTCFQFHRFTTEQLGDLSRSLKKQLLLVANLVCEFLACYIHLKLKQLYLLF